MIMRITALLELFSTEGETLIYNPPLVKLIILCSSAASTVSGYTGAVSSPYSGQARLLQQSYHGSPHIQNK